MPDMPCRVQGLRMPILRETKMPAVVCAVGPVDVVLQRATKVVDVVVLAVSEWLAEPLG
jgi:N-acetylmuramoyl-L-alanine amidase